MHRSATLLPRASTTTSSTSVLCTLTQLWITSSTVSSTPGRCCRSSPRLPLLLEAHLFLQIRCLFFIEHKTSYGGLRLRGGSSGIMRHEATSNEKRNDVFGAGSAWFRKR